jgi:hypothetical protein
MLIEKQQGLKILQQPEKKQFTFLTKNSRIHFQPQLPPTKKTASYFEAVMRLMKVFFYTWGILEGVV